MWSLANAATPLNSEQAFHSRVARLDHASSMRRPRRRGGIWWLLG
jgi:hypothetical protein